MIGNDFSIVHSKDGNRCLVLHTPIVLRETKKSDYGFWEWCLDCGEPTMHKWDGADWTCDHAMVNTILVATIKAITARNAEDLGYLEE
tara:strand:+ start:298 stop:561 length:264 start_codon:yes stop_codon:yes gene_type:complete